MNISYSFLKPEVSKYFLRFWRIRQLNIKLLFEEMGLEAVTWIRVVQSRDKFRYVAG
jgi:hypothetical protein